MSKRIIAFMMMVTLIFTSLPFDVLAEGEQSDAEIEQSVSDDDISVSGNEEITLTDDENDEEIYPDDNGNDEEAYQDEADEEEPAENEDRADEYEYDDDKSPADWGLTEYASPAATEQEIIRRMDEIKRAFPTESFFSVNGQACNHANSTKCDNCCSLKIIQDKLGFSDMSVFTKDWTCTSYAIFIYGYVFREAACESVNGKLAKYPNRCYLVTKNGVTYDELKSYVKPGDWIQVKDTQNDGYNHDMICYGWDNSNNVLLVFESNVRSIDKSKYTGHVNNGSNTTKKNKKFYVYRNPTYNNNGCPKANAPVVTGTTITEVNREGGYYTVKANITADAALDRVEFPTWTTANGQDDLVWPRGTVTSLGNNNYEATYTVQISDHNNERGQYNTHVYAFDCYGQSGMKAADSVNMDEQPSEPISFDVNLPAKGKANIYNIMCEKWGGQIKISKYVSSNKKVASVNKKGIVTGKKDGSATITAYIKSGKENVEVGSVIVNVSKPVFKFTNVDLTYAGKSINARDYLSNLAAGATTKWSISKSSQKIATIDENTGRITAGEKSGNVSVKCTISTYGYSCSYTAKLKVKIPKPSKSVKIKDGKSKKVGINNVSAYTSVNWRSSSPALTIEATKKSYKIKVSVDSTKDPSVLTQPATLTAVIDGVEYNTSVIIK